MRILFDAKSEVYNITLFKIVQNFTVYIALLHLERLFSCANMIFTDGGSHIHVRMSLKVPLLS